jgi:hypothetical protein
MQHPIYNANLIKQEVEKIRLCRHQMLLVVGKRRLETIEQFSRETGVEPVNLNLYLSEELLRLPVNRRGRKVGEFLNRLLFPMCDIIIFENIELLFLPELQIDPIRLFEDISRNKILIIEWNGKYENRILTYARPGHPEYRIYHGIDTNVIIAD